MVHPPNNYGSETGGRTPQRPEWLETGALYWGRPSKPALQGSTRLPEQPHAHFQHRASQTTQAQQSLQHPVTSYGWPPEKRRRIETYGAMPAQGSRPDGYFNTSSDAQGPADAELSSYNNQDGLDRTFWTTAHFSAQSPQSSPLHRINTIHNVNWHGSGNIWKFTSGQRDILDATASSPSTESQAQPPQAVGSPECMSLLYDYSVGKGLHLQHVDKTNYRVWEKDSGVMPEVSILEQQNDRTPTFDVSLPLYGVQAENQMISTYPPTDISAYYPNKEGSFGSQTTQLFSIGHEHTDTLDDPTPTFDGTVITQFSTHLTAPTEATSAGQHVQTNSYLQIFDYSNRSVTIPQANPPVCAPHYLPLSPHYTSLSQPHHLPQSSLQDLSAQPPAFSQQLTATLPTSPTGTSSLSSTPSTPIEERDSCTTEANSTKPLAQSVDKRVLFARLGLDKKTHKLLLREAQNARDILSQDPQNLTGRYRADPKVQTPYKWSQIAEIAKHRVTLMLVNDAPPRTKKYYAKGRYQANVNEENWVAKWYLWHSFRYRDNRNSLTVKDG